MRGYFRMDDSHDGQVRAIVRENLNKDLRLTDDPR